MKNKVSDKDLLALGKEVHSLLCKDEYSDRGMCSLYGVGYANGEVKNLKYRACHMGLMSDYWDGQRRVKPNCLVISNQVQTNYSDKFTKKNMLKYYDFLFNVSVFKDCYVTKDPSTCIEEGITVRTNKPANLVVAACIATRQAWEMRYISLSINRMIEFGVPPRKAHLVAHIIEVKEDGTFEARNERCHYSVYASSMNKKAIKNFLSGTLDNSIKLNKSTYKSARDYRHIPEMWGPYGKELIIEDTNNIPYSSSDPFGYIKSLGRLEQKSSVVDAVNLAFERIGL